MISANHQVNTSSLGNVVSFTETPRCFMYKSGLMLLNKKKGGNNWY